MGMNNTVLRAGMNIVQHSQSLAFLVLSFVGNHIIIRNQENLSVVMFCWTPCKLKTESCLGFPALFVCNLRDCELQRFGNFLPKKLSVVFDLILDSEEQCLMKTKASVCQRRLSIKHNLYRAIKWKNNLCFTYQIKGFQIH